MFYVTKRQNLISDEELAMLQRISGRLVTYNLKMVGAFGRKRRYYALRLQRMKRDRDRIIEENRSVWDPVDTEDRRFG